MKIQSLKAFQTNKKQSFKSGYTPVQKFIANAKSIIVDGLVESIC